jgi:hypothetical protein
MGMWDGASEAHEYSSCNGSRWRTAAWPGHVTQPGLDVRYPGQAGILGNLKSHVGVEIGEGVGEGDGHNELPGGL